jgi:hypothetical protein
MMRLFLLVMLALLLRTGMSQDLRLDTQDALDVIKKWNFAMNARSEQTLRTIYADKVIYYAKVTSREKCLADKRAFFNANPAFKQKIVSDPKFVAHTAGIVKSSFIREVFQNGKWKKIPSYLLISYEKNQYKITGESDPGTDAAANYTLEIGEPMDIPQSDPVPLDVASNDSVLDSDFTDTVQVASNDSITSDQSLKTEDSTLISTVAKEVLSEEPVAIPKKYIYVLIGLLVVIAAVAVFSRRPKKSSSKKKAANNNSRETAVTRNDKTFENFVIALFDPHYFTLKNHSRQRVMAGKDRQVDFVPGLEFEFQNKDSRVRIAIECIFIQQIASQQLLSYSGNQINRYHDFEDGTGMEVYIVVGIEGEANDPKELCLIPTADLREGYLGYQDLQPFRKHGMFFYNAVRRRLL